MEKYIGREGCRKEGGRQWAGVCRGLWGCSHWPQTGTGVWIAHIGSDYKLGWTSNLLRLWSFEGKKNSSCQLAACLNELAKLGGSTRSQTAACSMDGLDARGRTEFSLLRFTSANFCVEYRAEGENRCSSRTSGGVEVNLWHLLLLLSVMPWLPGLDWMRCGWGE